MATPTSDSAALLSATWLQPPATSAVPQVLSQHCFAPDAAGDVGDWSLLSARKSSGDRVPPECKPPHPQRQEWIRSAPAPVLVPAAPVRLRTDSFYNEKI